MEGKFCVNCKYCKKIGGATMAECWKCTRTWVDNPVTGEPQYLTCQFTREESATCGPKGKWFEEKSEI